MNGTVASRLPRAACPRRVPLLLGGAVVILLAAGCSGDGIQSILTPAGHYASEVEGLWWFFFGVAVVVWTVVTALLLYGPLRARTRPTGEAPEADARRTWAVAGGVGATIVILIAMFLASLVTGRTAEVPAGGGGPVVEVIGHRWWWEVRYLDDAGDVLFETANEIHLPVGRPVTFLVRTADVIHSFWIPNLHGKIDMIPGRTNTIRVAAADTGVYRGQCTEFCGLQHAKMGFMVVVETPDEYGRWLARQRRPASPPEDPEAMRGLQVFMTEGCARCHAVRGTPAAGDIGPELTHLASRLTLAAATLPNTTGHLGGWIANPQNVKPGNNMPYVPLESEQLRALLDYLGGLE